MRLNVLISLLEKESSTGSTLLSAWGAMSNQMEHIDATIAFSRRYN